MIHLAQSGRGASRRQLLAGAAGAAAAGTAVPFVRAARAADAYTLRMSTPRPPGDTDTIAAGRWAQAVARRSNGRLKIEIYPTSQLAKEQESIQGLTTGLVDITNQTLVFLEPIFPQVQVMSLPFIFKDAKAALRVVDGQIGNEIFADFETKGIVGLFWTFTGFRELETASKTIRTPADMRGVRWRIAGGATNVAMAQALGAIPVTIDISEAFVAMQQHTIDAVDSTLDAFVANKFYTIAPHVAMTNHVFTVTPVVASKSKVDSLPPDLQRILKEEARAVAPFWRDLVNKRTAEGLQGLRDKGISFNDIDYPAFRKAMDPVYAAIQTKLGGNLIERVSRVAGV